MADASGFQIAGDGAENYDRFVRVFASPFHEDLLRRAHLLAGDAVLDVACGTGFVARLAADRVGRSGRVVGLDNNGSMLAVAKRLSPSHIEWRDASAEAIPFEDSRFNAVTCNQGIQFFPNLQRGISEMVRVTASGGRVVASFWAGPLERSPYMAAYILQFARIVPESLADVELAFRLDLDDVATTFREHGLTDVSAETVEHVIALPAISEFLPGHVASLPIAAAFVALDVATRQQFCENVSSELAAYQESDGIHVPFVWHMVTGIKV